MELALGSLVNELLWAVAMHAAGNCRRSLSDNGTDGSRLPVRGDDGSASKRYGICRSR